MSLLLCWIIFFLSKSNAQIVPTPEVSFRKAARQWRSTGDYEIWLGLSSDLLNDFQSTSNHATRRLELIGAMEESILIIEKSTLHEGENLERDRALSKLYEAYGHVLMQLSAEECLRLAKYPYTLLIAAESADSAEPSTHLCIENAENSLRNAVSLDATNAGAQALLQQLLALSSDGIHKRKPKEFVAELFDSFADTFDEKLLKGLAYQVPKLLGQVVRKLRASGYRNALDAGCGTGLAGRYIRPVVTKALIGVDASQKMLDIASECTLSTGCGLETMSEPERQELLELSLKEKDKHKPLYSSLLAMDLESMTLSNTLGTLGISGGFDLIVAADVLVYFGRLDTLMETFASVSVPGALLLFSCERTTEEEAPMGWRLLPSGRFAHTKNHVQNAAQKAGYQYIHYQEIVPRMEKGEPVRGHMFGFEFVSSANNKLDRQSEEL